MKEQRRNKIDISGKCQNLASNYQYICHERLKMTRCPDETETTCRQKRGHRAIAIAEAHQELAMSS